MRQVLLAALLVVSGCGTVHPDDAPDDQALPEDTGAPQASDSDSDASVDTDVAALDTDDSAVRDTACAVLRSWEVLIEDPAHACMRRTSRLFCMDGWWVWGDTWTRGDSDMFCEDVQSVGALADGSCVRFGAWCGRTGHPPDPAILDCATNPICCDDARNLPDCP